MLYQYNQIEPVIKEEQYGNSTDDRIILDESSNVECVFKIAGEALQGVCIKFETEGQFKTEKIKAQLFDANTNKLLVENVIDLKYERIQNKDGGSYIYIPLSLEEKNGEKVRLAFSLEGENCQVYPALIISNNAINKSELLINGKQMNGNLVYYTRYLVGEKRNFSNSIGNFVIFLLFGTSIFFYFYLYKERSNQNAKNLTQHRLVEFFMVIKNILIKKCKFIAFLCMVGILVLYIIYVYRYSVINVIRDTYYYFLNYMYLILSISVLTVSCIIFYLCFINKITDHRKIFLIIFSLGILYCAVIAPDTVPDEPSHTDTAYAVSNKIMGIPDSDKPGYIYKRVEDINNDAEERQSLGVENYRWIYHNLFRKPVDTSLVECAVRNNLGNAGIIFYIPQALGISLGRILGLGMLPTLYLGRIFSLLCYVILLIISLKKIPVGKLTLLLIGVLPISLQQAASMSYDGIINAIFFLYLSYCLFAIYGKEKLKILDIIIIALSGGLIASVKGGVYFLLCFLPLLIIWRNKNITKNEKNSIILIIIMFCSIFIKERLFNTIVRLTATQGSVVGGSKNQQLYTFGYLLKNPIRLIGLYLNSIHEQADMQIRNLFGGNLAWRNVNIDWYIVILFIVIILISTIRNNNDIYISKTDRVFMGIIAFLTYILIELSMLLSWTPINLNYITGVQGRYFLPFILLILLCIRNSVISIKKNIDHCLFFGVCMLDLITILQVILISLNR